MFCSKCGTKNDEGSKFCSKCGETLEPKKNEAKASKTSSNPGGIRKAMKADAKKRVSGTFIGATAVYLVVCIILGVMFGINDSNTVTANDVVKVSFGTSVGEIITGLFGMVFCFGLLIAGFKAVKGKEVTFGEIFTEPFNKFKFIGYILLLTVIIFAISFVCLIIPIIGWIAWPILLIYYCPAIAIFMVLLADPATDANITFSDACKRSLEIVKGHRVEYYGTILSFFGWCLLGILTFGILYIWILPYMYITYVNMYRRWVGDEEFATDQTGISNGAVVGIAAGGCGCACILIIIAFAGLLIALGAALGMDKTDSSSIQNWIDKIESSDSQDNFDLNDFEDLIEGISEYTENQA